MRMFDLLATVAGLALVTKAETDVQKNCRWGDPVGGPECLVSVNEGNVISKFNFKGALR